MNATTTAIAHIAHPTTCDAASTHGIWILGSRGRCLGREESDGRCGIVEQTNSVPKNRRACEGMR